MTAPAAHLPRPTQASTASHPAGRATSAAPRHGSTGAQTGFAQLLRSQDDSPPLAADPAPTASATPATGNEPDARPTERDRERQPVTEDASPVATAAPPALAPAPSQADAPSTWTLAGLSQATTPANNATPEAADPGSAASDPLAALRDAMGPGLTAQRRHGTAADRQADRAANEGTNDGAKTDAVRFNQTLGDAAAEAAASTAPAVPAAVATPVTAAPGTDGTLPSLGAITDPAGLPHAAAPVAAEATATAHASLPATPGTPAFGPALGLQLSTWLKDGVQHASLELHPQDLGPIDVRIAVKDGQTRIDLSAEVASTRQALVDAMPQLSAALGDVGLSLTGGGVADPSAQGRQGEHAAAEAGRGAARSGLRGAGPGDAAEGPRAPAAARQHRGLLDLYA